MKTTFMANAQNVERKWYVVDAEGQTVGRLAAEVAKVLRGKHKPTFTPAGQMMEKFPTRVIEHAVRGMLPKNRLGEQMYRKLNVYAGSEHPHAAQQPEELKLSIR